MEKRILGFLRKCSSPTELRQIHAKILLHNLKDSEFIAPKLVSLSSQLCSPETAARSFRNLSSPNVVAYNSLIQCYIGKSHRAPSIAYKQMRASMVAPNSFTFTFLLMCLEPFEALREGRMIHGEILKSGNGSGVFVQNTLLSFYAKCCKDLEYARQVFGEMPQRDVVSWNSMIGAYMARGLVEPAIALFNSMPEKSNVTWNTMISGHSKVGKMELASSMFDNMPNKNDVSWNCMISGFVRVGDMKAAMCTFAKMPEKTVVSWTAMISGYTVIGDLKSAEALFDQMPRKNTVSWNAMITGYVHNHQFDQALALFHRMLIDNACKPDHTTLISALSACSHLGSLEQGKWIDSYIKKHKLEMSLSLGNALIDMFAKCGDLGNAKLAFDDMSTRCVITWTTMISGLAYNGKCAEALDLYDRMCSEGFRPDDVLFIAVLTACTHGGLVEDGKRVFSEMVSKFGIEPRIEHYGSMVDLLGRAGKLQEAIEFIEKMHLQPNSVIWGTLLSCCKFHGSKDILDTVIQKIMEQEPSNPSYLTLISNLKALVGQSVDGSIYRAAMREKGMEKVPGCSLIQVGDKVHEFVARDTNHENRREIYRTLSFLDKYLKVVHDDLGEIGLCEV
ncbi:pentatricopeptide repeat-containing protein At3g29230-like [Punica granatum]|uniref:Pentatricopeptide repeat-containing protein At3g29230-like n=1 Tax=Punica granatum TaxID=22663 RepID=A0A6P8DEY3_PUNGR|nr:pentatricopeptide repeat-containing protein At3g29230-like [Punica granatum]